jgi:hypothetical protein
MEMVYGVVDYRNGRVFSNQAGDIDRATAWMIIRDNIPGVPGRPCDEHSLTRRLEIIEVGEVVAEFSARSVDVTAFGYGGGDSGWEPPMVERKIYRCDWTILEAHLAAKRAAEKAVQEAREEANRLWRERDRESKRELMSSLLPTLRLPPPDRSWTLETEYRGGPWVSWEVQPNIELCLQLSPREDGSVRYDLVLAFRDHGTEENVWPAPDLFTHGPQMEPFAFMATVLEWAKEYQSPYPRWASEYFMPNLRASLDRARGWSWE